MPLYKFQVSCAFDSLLPKHQVVNTLHFNDGGLGTDADGLCQDLLEIMQTVYGTTVQIEVQAYEVGGAPPHFPVGRAIDNEGVTEASNGPREVAICLSFYAERNLPRNRGRIFIMAAPSIGTTGVRPTNANMTFILGLAQQFADLGGPDVQWGVYSPTDSEFKQVSNAWVDDEYDTIRSRGLDPSDRVTLAVEG